MQTNNNAAPRTSQAARDKQKVEVVIEGADSVALRYLTWTEGLGWCCQKTLRVDAEQLEDLHRSLTVARHRLNRMRAEEGLTNGPAQVIQLPTLA